MVVRAPASTRSPEQAKERLLIEAAQKDPARFAELYEINFERVYAYVVRRVGNRTETEDLTSEVFHQALANLKRFEWRGALLCFAWSTPCRTNSVVSWFCASSSKKVSGK